MSPRARAKDRLIVGYSVIDGEPQLSAAFIAVEKLTPDAMLFNGGDGVQRFYDRKAKLVETQLSPNPVPDYILLPRGYKLAADGARHKGIDLSSD